MVIALSSRTLARSRSSDGFPVLRAGWCDSEKICCLEAHGAIHREFLLGGAMRILRHFRPQEILKRYPPLDCGLMAHTTNPPLGGLSRGVRRELGVVLACLVVVPVRAWRCQHGGLRGSARGAKLEKQKNEGEKKKLEVSVSSTPEPQRPHHEGAFQGR